ncbi:unnamed protein product [Calypogeia fissa]
MVDIVEEAEKFFSQLTEEQKLLVINRAKKPSVNFSSATLADCLRKDGLALDLKYILARPFRTSLNIPEYIQRPTLSDFLCQHLDKVQKCFAMDNEAECRMLIDAILLEVLERERESEANLTGFCEVKNDWEGPGLKYTGTVDYMIGSAADRSVLSMDSFFLVMEAKKEWPDSAVAQVLAEAGCLLKRRLNSGKKTPVFAVLTNGRLFRFFVIDADGVVYSSEEMLGLSQGYASLAEILRWFSWFLGAMKAVSPRASQTDVTDDDIEDSLAQLRCCFGPRQPHEAIGPKRIKT